MGALQIFYSLAIGIGFGGLAFAITFHLFSAIRKGLRGANPNPGPSAAVRAA